MNDVAVEDYRDTVETRKRIRAALAERIISGEQPISERVVDGLLTDGTVEAFRALGNASFGFRELESGQQSTDDEDADG